MSKPQLAWCVICLALLAQAAWLIYTDLRPKESIIKQGEKSSALLRGKLLSDYANLLSQDNPPKEALAAVAGIGPVDKDLAPELIRLLLDRKIDGKLNEFAAALVRIGPAALPALHAALKVHTGQGPKETIIWIMGRMEEQAAPSVSVLTAELNGPAAHAAAAALAKIGPQAVPAVPALFARHTQRSGDIEGGFGYAVFAIGPDAVPFLVTILEDPSYQKARSDAAALLLKFGPEAKEAIPALVRALDDAELISQAEKALLRMDRLAFPALIELLDNSDPKARARGVRLLIRQAILPSAALPVLLSAVRDQDPAARYWSAVALEKAGLTDAKVRDAMTALAKDPDRKVRALARLVLEMNDAAARATVEPLLGWWAPAENVDQNVQVLPRKEAISNFKEDLFPDPKGGSLNARLRQTMADHHPQDSTDWLERIRDLQWNSRLRLLALLLALHSEAPVVRAKAAGYLQEHGKEAAEIIPALVEFLDDKIVQDSAITTLGTFGPAAKEVMPRLVKLGTNPAALLARWRIAQDREAVQALLAEFVAGKTEICLYLKAIGSAAPEIVPVLVQALGDKKDNPTRQAAAQALAAFGPEAKEAVGPLIAALEVPELQLEALSALVKIGPQAKEALPAYRKLLTAKNHGYHGWTIVQSTLRSIGKLGREGQDAFQDVVDIMEGKNPLQRRYTPDSMGELRGHAARCLADIAPPEKALPLLRKIITQRDHQFGQYGMPRVVEALGAMGPAAKPALPDLHEFLQECQKVRGYVEPPGWFVHPQVIQAAIKKIAGEPAEKEPRTK